MFFPHLFFFCFLDIQILDSLKSWRSQNSWRFQFSLLCTSLSVASCPIAQQHQKKPGSIPLTLSFQVLIYISYFIKFNSFRVPNVSSFIFQIEPNHNSSTKTWNAYCKFLSLLSIYEFNGKQSFIFLVRI